MKLSVIVPVFNEASTLKEVVAAVENIAITKEIILVDDGSTDGSREILTELDEEKEDLRALFHDRNQGKGAALRTGFAAATGDILLVQDADLEYDPLDFPRLVAPIMEDKADVVFGSRFAGGEAHRVLYFWHSVGNRFLTLLSNMFTNLNLSDMETGYKVFRHSAIEGLVIQENRFGFEPEITTKFARRGCRVYEVGISYHGRSYEQGKKIGWRDGFRAIWCIVKYGVSVPKDASWGARHAK